jgi:hypothetical protein
MVDWSAIDDTVGITGRSSKGEEIIYIEYMMNKNELYVFHEQPS